MAAKISKVISVTTAPPFWKNTPAMAGSKASPSGADCQCDSSCMSTSFCLDTRGSNRSSVEDRIELRASETETDNVELRRGFEKCAESSAVKVGARDSSRWRRPGFISFSFSLFLIVSVSGLLFVNEVRGESDDGRRGCSAMVARSLQDAMDPI